MSVFVFLYNKSYGGFGFSERFHEYFFEKYDEMLVDRWSYQRDDQRIFELVQELGVQASQGDCCRLAAKSFPIKYKGFIYVHEYDGKETIGIDYDMYFVHKFRSIDPHDSESMKALQDEIAALDRPPYRNIGEPVKLND